MKVAKNTAMVFLTITALMIGTEILLDVGRDLAQNPPSLPKMVIIYR